jgi:hypothetical protein
LTQRGVGPIIATAGEGLGMSDPDRHRQERSINRMTMVVFVLAAIAALISIIYVRPLPVADEPPRATSPK